MPSIPQYGMAPSLTDLSANDPVCSSLLESAANGTAGHAYLLYGDAGSNAVSVARAFARALVSTCGGCGTCDACRLARAGTHPDIREWEPEGASSYLVEQIREIVADASLAPVLSNRTVYILHQAELMNGSSANAFLKTLEEPADHAVFVLVARTPEAVLDTIASRCRLVPLRRIPSDEALAAVIRASGATPACAKSALHVCAGSLEEAIAFASSDERLRFRSDLFRTLSELASMDSHRVLQASKAADGAAREAVDALAKRLDARADELSDVLQKSALKRLSERNARIVSAAKRERVLEAVSLCESWLRDALSVRLHLPDRVVNDDILPDLLRSAESLDERRIATALCTANRIRELIAYNVNPRLCLDSLLLEVKEDLYG